MGDYDALEKWVNKQLPVEDFLKTQTIIETNTETLEINEEEVLDRFRKNLLGKLKNPDGTPLDPRDKQLLSDPISRKLRRGGTANIMNVMDDIILKKNLEQLRKEGIQKALDNVSPKIRESISIENIIDEISKDVQKRDRAIKSNRALLKEVENEIKNITTQTGIIGAERNALIIQARQNIASKQLENELRARELTEKIFEEPTIQDLNRGQRLLREQGIFSSELLEAAIGEQREAVKEREIRNIAVSALIEDSTTPPGTIAKLVGTIAGERITASDVRPILDEIKASGIIPEEEREGGLRVRASALKAWQKRQARRRILRRR